MKVMGHRGAAGLALENTLDSFELAKLLGVNSIELDLHITKDGKLVVVHDGDLKRVSNGVSNLSVKSSTLKQIQSITLADGHSAVPTLDHVIEQTNSTPLIIEIKADGCIDELLKVLNKYKVRDFTVVSFKHNELQKLRKLAPNLRIYGLERTKPIEIIQLAKSMKLDGIGLNYWLLNPLTYWLSKRWKLSIYVYTVNSRFIGKIIQTLYPDVVICTDFPERFLKQSLIPTKVKNSNS